MDSDSVLSDIVIEAEHLCYQCISAMVENC